MVDGIIFELCHIFKFTHVLKLKPAFGSSLVINRFCKTKIAFFLYDKLDYWGFS